MISDPIRSISSKHEPITSANARTYLAIDTAWLAAIRRESKLGAKVSPWLLATVSMRIALAEAIITAASTHDAPHDLLTGGQAA
jgi:hypothetical protein